MEEKIPKSINEILPNEILTHIFNCYVNPVWGHPPGSLLHLALVCRRWRFIIRDTPKLKKRLSYNYTLRFTSFIGSYYPMNILRFNRWLTETATSELRLNPDHLKMSFYIGATHYWNQIKSWESFKKITSLALEIHLSPYAFDDYLEELHASQKKDFDHFKEIIQIFKNELQYLELRTYNQMSLNFNEMFLPKLEHLTLIYKVQGDAEFILDDVKFEKMKNFPKLKTLTII